MRNFNRFIPGEEVGAVSQTVLRGVDGHYMPPSFVSQAWGFLGSRRR